MGAFEYQALDDRGKQRRGVLEGDTARQVRQKLREQGWIPLDVDEIAQRSSKTKAPLRLAGGANAAEVALITRQMATLIGSGLPLEEALQAVAQQSEKPKLKNMMTAVRSRVMEGHTLADGLGAFPRAFPDLYRATVAAGEQTGHLELVLDRLADYTEGRQHMRQKVQLALFYPLGLMIVAVSVVVLLLTYVVPKITEVFADVGQELPGLTVAMINISDFLRNYGLFLLVGLIGAGFAFAYGMRFPGFRRPVHNFMLRVPLVGRLNRSINAGRFARTFSILAGSGVPVLEALKIAAEVITNVPMREAVEEAAARVREGASISGALERTKQFPPMMQHLISSGEASGRLESMLERAAMNQEREIESRIATMMAVFEPLLILGMGGMVLLIVMAVLMPIFQLNQLVG